MRESLFARCRKVVLVCLVAVGWFCAGPECVPTTANTEDTSTRDEQLVVIPSTSGPSQIALTGTTEEFGRYIASGEITYAESEEEGPQSGTGVAVVQAEDGDVIVADLTSEPQEDGTTNFTFHWRDSVMFSNGTVVPTTGRFVDERPPGLVRVYRCGVCCTKVCALPPFDDCRFVCYSCNCRYVVVEGGTRSPPGPP